MKRKAETKTGDRRRLKIKKESLIVTLSFIAQKIFALEQMEEWFSEVGCWLLRIRIMGDGFFNGLGKGLWQDMD